MQFNFSLLVVAASLSLAVSCKTRTFEPYSKSYQDRSKNGTNQTCEIKLATYNIQNAYDCVEANNHPNSTPRDYQDYASNWYRLDTSAVDRNKKNCQIKSQMVAEAIQKYIQNPDILALQELEYGQASGEFLGSLKTLINETNAKSNSLTGPSKEVFEYQTAAMLGDVMLDQILAQGFLSRFTFSTVKFMPVDNKGLGDGIRAPVVITFKEIPNISFVSIHWPTPNTKFTGSDKSKSTARIESVKSIHLALAKSLKDEIEMEWRYSPEQAFVIMGDFNDSDETNETFGTLLNDGAKSFKSIWSIPNKPGVLSSEGTTSFRDSDTNSYTFGRFDKILFSHHFFDKDSPMKVTSGPVVIGRGQPFMSGGAQGTPKKWFTESRKSEFSSTAKDISAHIPAQSGPSDHFPLMATIQVPCQKP